MRLRRHGSLTEEIVIESRIAVLMRREKTSEVAKRFGVPYNALYNAIRGWTWKHIQMPTEKTGVA